MIWWALALVVQQPIVELKPTSKWAVQYQEDACVASRAYGDENARIVVGIRPVTWGDKFDIVVAKPHRAGLRTYRLGRGNLSFEDGETIAGRTRSGVTADGKLRTTSLELPREKLVKATTAAKLHVSADDQRIRIAQAGSTALVEALAKCEADLKAQTEVSVEADKLVEIAKSASGATGASGNPAYWIGPSDYPMEAVRLGLQGTTAARWIIGKDGRVTKCAITERSDHPALDALVCKVLIERARYQPARDSSGQPVAQAAIRRIVWRLPGRRR